ncbi:PHD finger protein 3 isoform X2 [Latimeria chalumnae]|uniref:PHD finger protein 3 isoform X2 n=1 Tax=Latimeria chalumnae TaxID=7897 RepID=UPI0003C1A164|nr:PREDICTED: PHD finger protein 3 isoform X2 [Latimeria chalumnae]|eukprot:XP_006010803.1 PREDICTED: PHD finger protein 3 isoform X2 [Latimeria chalumnae]
MATRRQRSGETVGALSLGHEQSSQPARTERLTEVFMDIVDTFNHLIPTDHLDEALFLGSNLETEVCDEFGTSHNVQEDSLKNMLSDKDPMLGSASSQFCLPVSDDTDTNFQMTCSTVVGLDDIMDENDAKEGSHDTIEEEELMLSGRSLRSKSTRTSLPSPRKSPRLMAQEPIRSLRQSTLSRRSNNVAAATVKKKPVKSGFAQRGLQKSPQKQLQSTHLSEEDEGSIKQEPEQQKEVRRSGRKSEQTTQEMPIPIGRRSVRSIGKESSNDVEPEDKSQGSDKPIKMDDDSVDNLKNCPVQEENLSDNKDTVTENKMENIIQEPLNLTDGGAKKEQDDVGQGESSENTISVLIPEPQSNELKDVIDEVSLLEENRISDITTAVDMPSELISCENPSEMHQELEILSQDLKENVDSSSDLAAPVMTSEIKSESTGIDKLELVDSTKCITEHLQAPAECKEEPQLEKAEEECTKPSGNEPEKSLLETCNFDEALNQNVHQQKNIKSEGQESTNLLDTVSQKSLYPLKNLESPQAKHKVKPQQNRIQGSQMKLATEKQLIRLKKKRMNADVQTTLSPQKLKKQFSTAVKRKVNEKEVNLLQKPTKIQRTQVGQIITGESCSLKVKPVQKKTRTLVNRALKPQDLLHPQASKKPLAHDLGQERLQSHQASKGAHQPVSKHLLHQTKQLPHSSQKQLHHLQKHSHLIPCKSMGQLKEEVEEKDKRIVDQSKEDEKEKLKLKKSEKGLQPRQRRSSKSLSLDEPPLFIPDNMPAVKKEGSEGVPSSDNKDLWDVSKHCGICRKPHSNRFMVGCGRCDDWFHGDCVGLSLSQAQQMEQEDKEYICMKCCAEEDKKVKTIDQSQTVKQSVEDYQTKPQSQEENRTLESEKVVTKPSPASYTNVRDGAVEKTKPFDDTVKHKVKIFRKESTDRRNSAEFKELESKKPQQVPDRKIGSTGVGTCRPLEEKHEKVSKDFVSALGSGEKASKAAISEKQEVKKKKEKGSSTNINPSVPSAPKPSVEQIRQSVRHSLRDILVKRLTVSSLKVPEERPAKVAAKIEKHLFTFFRDTDSKYKNKYRSLMFNLKDPKNNVLYKRVLKGDVSPDHLIRMSPEELASKELAAWRQRENRHTIEMIEKEQREVERRPITKITHKGEIEIESEAQIKETEVMEVVKPPPKVVEKVEVVLKEAEPESTKDTTNQHKNHLFDLNCKICTGRMAPPVDDKSPNKPKVVTGVVRRQSDNESDTLVEALSSTSSVLAFDPAEEPKEESPDPSFSASGRSDTPGILEDESTFLARLHFIWKGFINMPSVAKLVTKAYPVSGTLEYLTEDLPDSIQVGGRISPQTVWDYVEKIKASGTKEICIVRFCPASEEDQISYTLLYAYFSSRRRYGVVANNMRQVKDMYLIPLGTSEKVPHHLVPFDGPGLEACRSNLLLGLIIRQRMKRQLSTSLSEDVHEGGHSNLSEKKSKIELKEQGEEEVEEEDDEDENDFFNSFTTVLHKHKNRPPQSEATDVQKTEEPVPDQKRTEPPKPLRFLPGVLVGWENQPSPLDLISKPLPVDDILQSLLGTTGNICEETDSILGTNKEKPLSDEKSSAKEPKKTLDKSSEGTSYTKGELNNLQEYNAKKLDTSVGRSSDATNVFKALTLKDKPPDVSTEAFLSLIQSQQEETVEKQQDREPGQHLAEKTKGLNENQDSLSASASCSPVKSSTTTGNSDFVVNASSVEAVSSTSRSPQFINLKKDPRQATGRNQQSNVSVSTTEVDSSAEKGGKLSLPNQSKDKEGSKSLESKPTETDKQSLGEQDQHTHVTEVSRSSKQLCLASSAMAGQTNLKEEVKLSEESGEVHNTVSVLSLKQGSVPGSSSYESCTAAGSELPLKGSPVSPAVGGNFSPVGSQQHNFPPPSGIPFQGLPSVNFNTQSNLIPRFPPHLPQPPPPGFGFPQGPPIRFHPSDCGVQNPMVPWHTPVHQQGQPPHFMGPIPPGPPFPSEQSRYGRPQKFHHSKDDRPERRHSDLWDRPDYHSSRGFSRDQGKFHRQRFHSDSFHQRKDQHKKDWDFEKERKRHWSRGSERGRRREKE